MILQQFVNRVLNSPELKANSIVVDFLTSMDEKKFRKALKQHQDRIKTPTGLDEYFTLTGKHTLSNEPSSFLFCKKFGRYIQSIEKLSMKFHTLSGKLATQMIDMA